MCGDHVRWPRGLHNLSRRMAVWKYLVASVVLGMGIAVSAGERDVRPEDTRYEVYYFHASWRCVNCNNAEAWAKEEVEALVAENGEGSVVFFSI